MNENKISFEEFLKDCVSAGNNIIKTYFDVQITGKDTDVPEVIINATEDKDELQILLVFLGFTISANEGLDKFIDSIIQDEETATICKRSVMQIIATLHAVCEEKLKLLKETQGEQN